MKKIDNSEIAAAMHEMMSGFYEAGAIPKSTMREFDALCLVEAPEESPMREEHTEALVRRPQ